MFTKTQAGIAIHDPAITSPWTNFSAGDIFTVGGPETTPLVCGATFWAWTSNLDALTANISSNNLNVYLYQTITQIKTYRCYNIILKLLSNS